MIRPETKVLLEQLGKNQFGHALREFLEEKRLEIKDSTNIPKGTAEEMAAEVIGRQFAIALIKDLFAFMEERKPLGTSKNKYE